jgi:hypothetical protein
MQISIDLREDLDSRHFEAMEIQQDIDPSLPRVTRSEIAELLLRWALQSTTFDAKGNIVPKRKKRK